MDAVVNVDAIDNDRMLLEGMSVWVTSTEDIRIVNMAGSVEEFLNISERSRIVLLDLNLEDFVDPVLNVQRLVSAGHSVIVMSVIPDVEHIVSTTEAGASAYVTKENNLSVLADVIRRTAAGESPMTSEHAFWLSRDARPTRPKLSAQEKKVLDLYASGATLDAVARRAGIRPGTAREYLSRIKRKYADVGRPIVNRVDYATRLREDRFGRSSIDGRIDNS